MNVNAISSPPCHRRQQGVSDTVSAPSAGSVRRIAGCARSALRLLDRARWLRAAQRADPAQAPIDVSGSHAAAARRTTSSVRAPCYQPRTRFHQRRAPESSPGRLPASHDAIGTASSDRRRQPASVSRPAVLLVLDSQSAVRRGLATITSWPSPSGADSPTASASHSNASVRRSVRRRAQIFLVVATRWRDDLASCSKCSNANFGPPGRFYG